MPRSIGTSRGKVVSSSLNAGEISGVPLLSLVELPPDTLTTADVMIDGDAESLILYREPEGGVRAWHNICPHAGRRLDYAPGKFLRTKRGELMCAVHGATFALPEGVCVAGPCRGGCLRVVAVHVADGQVRLGSMATVKDPSQAD